MVLLCGGVANAQIVTPVKAPRNPGTTTALPSGAPPQVMGYSAANTAESETVGGDMTFSRTGPNVYTATVSAISGKPVGALATLNSGTGLTATTTTLSLTAPVTVALGGTGTITPPSVAGQLLIAQSVSAYGPVTATGDATISSAGVISVTKIAGATPGGVCGGSQFVSSISASGVPTCTTPAISGIPTGSSPMVVGYTPVGAAEAETISGGAGGCTLTRTGAGAYQMVCSNYTGSTSPTFTGTMTAATINATQVTASTGVTVSSGGTFSGPDGGIWTNSGINDGTIKATVQFTFPDGATWTTAGLNNGTHLGIGQPAGSESIDITKNQNQVTEIAILNNSNTTLAQAGISFTNNAATAGVGVSSATYTGSGSSTTMRPNALYVWSDLAGGISIGNDTNATI